MLTCEYWLNKNPHELMDQSNTIALRLALMSVFWRSVRNRERFSIRSGPARPVSQGRVKISIQSRADARLIGDSPNGNRLISADGVKRTVTVLHEDAAPCLALASRTSQVIIDTLAGARIYELVARPFPLSDAATEESKTPGPRQSGQGPLISCFSSRHASLDPSRQSSIEDACPKASRASGGSSTDPPFPSRGEESTNATIYQGIKAADIRYVICALGHRRADCFVRLISVFCVLIRRTVRRTRQ